MGVAVQSVMPGTLRNSQGDGTLDRGFEPGMFSDWDCSRHFSELISGAERMELMIRRRTIASGESSTALMGGALVSNEQEMDKTLHR